MYIIKKNLFFLYMDFLWIFYVVVTLSSLYLTVLGIILPSFKSIGHSNMPEITQRAIRK